MATKGQAGESLAIGAVLGRAFGVMRGNPLTVFGIAFLLGALPQGILGYAVRAEATSPDPAAQAGLVGLYMGYGLVVLLCSALAQSALVRASSAYLEGRSASIGESLSVGLAKVLPVIGVSILLSLGLMVGFLLLFVPAIILALMWIVAIPALVEENTGVIGAFGRSRYLTKGSRWQIFALMIVLLVIIWLVALLAFIPGAILGLGVVAAAVSPAATVLSLVTTTVTTALSSTLITTLYFALRERQDGPQAAQLADVFA
ncbi:glycerophosphoryl diester phosphodiesterase membrane domain-containing protein [Sphingomonas radiodurans]|uniref:glycerophosphoryl diester phosphodiesterase membrane domain-containing protein n=1 Tax=Sphingomonas radiodurans TaxID=2890321 RepID=UPI001E2A038E|nr:glycerophosphoryl diester phosphodiesterase membrane domain-containing protein [Sphingomonas radiodurans]WBH18166.1 glycerophosphoryl diester phosphodiesterase membrane domain-containing protein [Sphingomonas radiodurans]